jgi:hypothetical protein
VMDVAPVAVAVYGDHRPAALTASQEAAEKRPRDCPSACARASLRPNAMAVAYTIPQLCRDDPKLWRNALLPLSACPIDIVALACLRILEPLPAVPYEAADVLLVVQDARTALRVAHHGAHCPRATAGARSALFVQPVCDPPRAVSIGEQLEDLPHDYGCAVVNYKTPTGTIGSRFAWVAEANAADMMAAVELTSEAAVCLLAKIIKVQLVHQSSGR